MPLLKIAYGPSEDQYILLHDHALSENADPLVILIHGGFWKKKYHIKNSLLHDSLPLFLKQHTSYYIAELEYRRVDKEVGVEKNTTDNSNKLLEGWPYTNLDILMAFHALHQFSKRQPKQFNIDFSKVIILGHSAGATLGLWACCSGISSLYQNFQELQSLHVNELLFSLPFTPKLCVAISPIGSLELGYSRRLSDDGDAVERYMGHKPSYSSSCNYQAASPDHLLPLRCDCLLVSGGRDTDVPQDIVDSFYQQMLKKQLNKKVISLNIPDADHYQLVDGKNSAWHQIFHTIISLLE